VVETVANYDELGWLMITATLIGLLAPLLTVVIIQRSPLQTHQ
jgi:hypothetical protein